MSWLEAADRPPLYAETLYASSSVLGTIAVGVAGALLAGAVARSRRLLTALTGTALAVVLGLTLVPVGGWTALAVERHAWHSIAVNVCPERSDLSAWLHASDGPPNVALFVPLGFFLALLLRRPMRAAAVAVVLSFAIECYQASLTTRVGSFADVVANGLGAVIGATAALVVLSVLAWRRPGGRGEPLRERPVASRASRQ
jgi:hypothetical protein